MTNRKESRIEIDVNREAVINQSMDMIKGLKDGESIVVILVSDDGDKLAVKTTVGLHGSTAEGMVEALEETKTRMIESIANEDPNLARMLKLRSILEQMANGFDED